MKKYILLYVFSVYILTLNAQQMNPWDLDVLNKAPKWKITTTDQVEGLTSILYKSIDYLGKPVEVYAYYGVPIGTPPEGGWPAVLFSHGGGGTAFPEWVNYWTSKGYAAISMDLEGHNPAGKNGKRKATPNPGPSRKGTFNDFHLPIDEQWYYHAVSQIILGHSLIASFSEVNANKIGLMGISWGGILTSTIMGVDNRLKWAIPIYGTGYLSGSDGHQGRVLQNEAKMKFVNTNYDGSAYFDNVTIPTLWVNGTNDIHFPLTTTQKSSQAIKSSTILRYTLGLNHGHSAPLVIDEIYHFANSIIKGENKLAVIHKPFHKSGVASVTFSSVEKIKSAQLLYTLSDAGVIWPKKEWVVIPATISGNTISATIPSGAYAVFFTVTDSRGLMVSSEYLLTSRKN